MMGLISCLEIKHKINFKIWKLLQIVKGLETKPISLGPSSILSGIVHHLPLLDLEVEGNSHNKIHMY